MSRSNPIKIVLIEDDQPFRDSVRMLLDGTPGFDCVGAWPTIETALHAIPRPACDLVLLDIHLPGMPGDQGVSRIQSHFADAIIVMFTATANDDKVFASLCRGASGYLLKSTPPARLLEAIEEASAGGSPMSPAIARKVVTLVRNTIRAEPLEEPLTDREIQLLTLLADGYQYQRAADSLGISINTIRNHIRSIYEKLRVHSRSEAVSKALRAGVI